MSCLTGDNVTVERELEMGNKGDETLFEAFKDTCSLKCSTISPPDWLLPLHGGQSCQSSKMAV